MSSLSLTLFGEPCLMDGETRVKVGRRKALALLALLALADQPQGRDTLCAVLWPELDAEQGRRALRSTLTELTKRKPSDWLEKDGDTLALNPQKIDVDVRLFLRLIARSRNHDHPPAQVCEACEPVLGQAADLGRSGFLAGFALPGCIEFDNWQTTQREWLQRELSRTLWRLTAYYRAHSAYDEAHRRAQQWLNLDPLNESAHRELMHLYVLTGRRTEALRQYQQCAKVLEAELSVAPEEETTQLYKAIQAQRPYSERGQGFVMAQVGSALSGPNLPTTLSPFIGRGREVDEAKRLLRASRLLTLTGAGGTGKTRLALQVAAEAGVDFSEGVYFIDLAPLATHTLVANAIAGALGVFENPAEPLPNTLKRALAGRTLLLVIDNFEHVIAAAPLVSELLSATADVKALVTSRESLRLAGEQEYWVQPLSLPQANASSVQSLKDSEAVALFVQRVQLLQPGFVLDDSNAAAVARICTRLDGLPLALELAAARCKLLAPQALADQLAATGGGSPLATLSGGSRDAPQRHRTLRDTMTWSHNLLGEEEQRLFARLAVFRGGCSLEAAEAVCGEGLALPALDGLTSLVDKSLVQQITTPAGDARFVLLETIHEFAREKLEASGEAESLRGRHAGYFVALAERAEPDLRRARFVEWSQRFEREGENLRAVLDWSLGTGDATQGVRLAGALAMFWYSRGYHVEGLRWTRRLLERLDEAPYEFQARFLIGAGRVAFLVDLDTARRLFARALEISRELGDRLQEAWALTFLGFVTTEDPIAAMEMATTSLTMFRGLDHQPGVAQALNIVGELARLRGDDAHAKAAYEECLEVSQQTGEALRVSYSYINLAYLAQHEGDHERVKDLLRRALPQSIDPGGPRDIAVYLSTYAGSAAACNQPWLAARLLGAAEATLARMGAFHQPGDRPEVERIIAAVRAQLGPDSFHTAWMEGQSLTPEEAVAYTLADTNAPASPYLA